MTRGIIFTAIASLFLLGEISPARTQELPSSGFDDFQVANPFVSDVARENFKKCYPDTTGEQLDAFKRIKSWGYQFGALPDGQCPPTAPDCNPKLSPFFHWRRTITFEADEGSPERVFAGARAIENGSCTKPVEVGGFASNIELKRVQYQWHVRGRKRICPPWGGSMTVAEGEADVVSGYNLQPDFSMSPFGGVQNEQGSFLGITNGGIAQAIVALAFGSLDLVVPFVALEMTKNDLLAKLKDQNFLSSGVNLSKYVSDGVFVQLNKAGHYEMSFRTNVSSSGFRLDGNALVLDYLHDAYVGSLFQRNAEQIRRLEIDFLTSLSEINPEMYTVKEGDNLWTLVGRKYGDPRLFMLIAEYNGQQPRLLHVGEVLKLPRWHELCDKLKPSQLFVRDKESLWEKAKSGQIPFDFTKVLTRSRKKNLIFPYEELKLLP